MDAVRRKKDVYKFTKLMAQKLLCHQSGEFIYIHYKIRVIGFEPMTSCSQNRRATRLRYTLVKSTIRADNGNRTHMVCLEGREFTINLYPQKKDLDLFCFCKANNGT